MWALKSRQVGVHEAHGATRGKGGGRRANARVRSASMTRATMMTLKSASSVIDITDCPAATHRDAIGSSGQRCPHSAHDMHGPQTTHSW